MMDTEFVTKSSNVVILLMIQKSQTTTWDVRNPVNNGIFTISTGAGYLPSTVSVLSMESTNLIANRCQERLVLEGNLLLTRKERRKHTAWAATLGWELWNGLWQKMFPTDVSFVELWMLVSSVWVGAKFNTVQLERWNMFFLTAQYFVHLESLGVTHGHLSNLGPKSGKT